MATTINLDTSQRVDIICKRGDSFSLRLTLTNSSGTAAFTADDIFLMQVRDSDTNDSATAADITLTTSETGIDPSNQTYIDFSFDSATMKAVPSGLYVYDIEQQAYDGATGPTVSTLIYGTFKVNEDVSITA
jgi:hypothetical protein